MLTGAYSGSTIQNYSYGVQAWHILHGLPWEMNEPEMVFLLKGAEKVAPASAKQKKRVPYTPDFMTAIKDQLNLSKPFDSAVYACLTTTFYTAAHLSKFVIPNLKSFDAVLHVKPSDIKHETDHNRLHFTIFHIPRTKVSIHGEDVSWSRQNGLTDPEAAFKHHLEMNTPPPNSALFAYRYKNGHRPMTKPAFLKALAKAAKSAGLKPHQGHGIRIGLTLEYLLRGVPFEVVKVKG
ncbi:unnamed protein product [Cyclocybe aegerita]|uniref:Tyr recombinase domain-containing protein n=1 Tax=Cyclocybe aegerita TaxID=1973307 RepID=A0A8S0WPV6_CYCAE|nr:unnamed protein product [Cyclocybe aegerita]